jgi:hypothetical protein
MDQESIAQLEATCSVGDLINAHVYAMAVNRLWTMKSATRTATILRLFQRYLDEVCDAHRLSEVRPIHVTQYAAVLRAIPANYHGPSSSVPRSVSQIMEDTRPGRRLSLATRRHHLRILRCFLEGPIQRVINGNFQGKKWSVDVACNVSIGTR